MVEMPAAPATIIIPARLGSTRFPRKVLADATGWPLIRHVWHSAGRAACADQVVIATDDRAVADLCESFGARTVLTSVAHPNGTSRLAEAAAALSLPADRIVVNVQGDEPEIDPSIIDAAVGSLLSTGAEVATVASPVRSPDEAVNPNVVKVVLRTDFTALYFSRAPIPFDRAAGAGAAGPAALRHVGLYAYRVDFLTRYAALPQTPLEQLESLEQLRVLEHGHRIGVAIRESSHEGIDTPEQYARFVERWKARTGPVTR